MKPQYTILITTHYKFGLLLVPFWCKIKHTSTEEIDILEPVTKENSENNLSEIEEQIVSISSYYSDKHIYQLHCKDKKKWPLIKFIDGLSQDIIDQSIRPSIERRLQTIIGLIYQHKIPIFIKDRRQRNILQSNALKLHPNPCRANLQIHYNGNTLTYKATVIDTVSNRVIPILENNYNSPIRFSYFSSLGNPAYIILNNILYEVHNIEAGKLTPFHKRESQIAETKKTIEQFFKKFLFSIILNYDIEYSGFEIVEQFPNPETSLKFEVDSSGYPALLLCFVYNETEICNNSANTFLKLSHTSDTYNYLKWHRNPEKEQQIITLLKDCELIQQKGTSLFRIPIPEHSETVDEKKYGFWWIAEWYNKYAPTFSAHNISLPACPHPEGVNYCTGRSDLTIQIKENTDWFDIQVLVTFGTHKIPFSVIRKAIIRGNKTLTLPDQSIAIIPSEWFARYKDIFLAVEDRQGLYTLKKVHYPKLSNIKEGQHSIRGLQKSFDLEQFHNTEIPSDFRAALRNYQKIGYFWMTKLREHNFGGCLADDMGLGKTVQTIALLLDTHRLEKKVRHISLFERHEYGGTSLIIAPTSLLFNWESELHKFAPTLKVVNLTQIAHEHRYPSYLQQANIVLCSYALSWRLESMLRKIEFTYLILDESQYIKNPNSQTYKTVNSLRSKWRLALTGTPIENRLEELWAQMNFLNTNILGSLSHFQHNFITPIKNDNTQRIQQLKQHIQPFLLRRTKQEVAPELPPLTQQVIYCEMYDEQKRIYESEKSRIRNFILDQVESVGRNKSSIVILKGLSKLRMIANHPQYEDATYKGKSGKLESVIQYLDNLLAENHKVLVFSNYKKQLLYLQQYAESQKYKYLTLTGETPQDVRRKNVNLFQSPNSAYQIFFISMKAGGTGLNLTAATYTILLDPWWNPQTEEQAISRIFRIGQEFPTVAYRFITKESIEEKIEKLQQEKNKLSSSILDNTNMNNFFSQISDTELTQLLS